MIAKVRILLLLIVIVGFYLVRPSRVVASSPTWKVSYSDNNLGSSGRIVISDDDLGIVYASIYSSGKYDLLKSLDYGLSWKSIKGDLPVGNDINWISVSKSDPEKIVVSLWKAGVFQSNNGGANWVNIFDSLFPRSVEIDPTNSEIIYVGIGGNVSQSGLYKRSSTNDPWKKFSALGDRNNAQITIDPNNNLRILADTDPNFYLTENGGINWVQLGINRAFSTGSVFDNNSSDTFYTGHFESNEGIYKSSDRGINWQWKNNGFVGKPFHITQNSGGNLFVTRDHGQGGGVWESKDAGDSWSNIADPVWGNAETTGMDIKSGRIFVAVSGLGIYYADVVPPGPKPIVVVPGFGGSWSTKRFLLHDHDTVQSDWSMMPIKAPEIYDPFLNALGTLNYLRDDKVFFFAYDFTDSIKKAGEWLNVYLEDVQKKNEGRKADLVGHSMGGLVIRYCFELVPGCRTRIDKIVTAGTPHLGAVDDYYFWEGAKYQHMDSLAKYGAKLLLHVSGLPKWDELSIIQNEVKGAQDFMPVFDYIANKPYLKLSDLGKNLMLKTTLPLSPDFAEKTLALSGNLPDSTSSVLSVKDPTKKETENGYWVDGKPHNESKSVGDGTVLQMSSQVGGANNKNYAIEHGNYLNTNQPVGDILQYLGLSPIGPLQLFSSNSSTLIYSISPLLEIKTDTAPGESVTQAEKNVLFINNSTLLLKRKIDIYSPIGGTYEVRGWYTNEDDLELFSNNVKVSLLPGEIKQVELQFN